MRIKSTLIVALFLMAVIGAQARQKPEGKASGEPAQAPAAASTSQAGSPADLARQAVASHGGEKFRNLKSLSLFGSAELYYGSNPSRSTVGKFAIVQAGDRARTDIETPDMTYREIHDGKRPYSTVNPASVWLPTKFGLPVLAHFDQAGYAVTALPDAKNLRGFRIADAEGNATDFFIDQATGRVMQYSFDYHGIKYLFEQKSFKEVEGVLVAYNFVRKMVLPRVDVYMEFKVKEAKVNQPVGDDVFIIPEH